MKTYNNKPHEWILRLLLPSMRTQRARPTKRGIKVNEARIPWINLFFFLPVLTRPIKENLVSRPLLAIFFQCGDLRKHRSPLQTKIIISWDYCYQKSRIDRFFTTNNERLSKGLVQLDDYLATLFRKLFDLSNYIPAKIPIFESSVQRKN